MVAHQARRAAEYGVRIDGGISVDMRAVKARKDKIVATSRDGIEIWLGTLKGLHCLQGACALRVGTGSACRRQRAAREADFPQCWGPRRMA